MFGCLFLLFAVCGGVDVDVKVEMDVNVEAAGRLVGGRGKWG